MKLKDVQTFLRSLFLLVTLIISPQFLVADTAPINSAAVAPNIAEIRVSDEGVRIKLEVFVRDISVFDALVPDSWFKDDSSTLPPMADRLKKFAQSGLSVRGPDGEPLAVIAELVEARTRIDRASPLAGKRHPITGQIVPAPPNDKRVLFAELFYPFEGSQPNRITITPPAGEDGNLQASIGMIVFDRNVPVIDFRYLSGKETLNIDWQDPWYTRFDNQTMLRHYRFPIMTFLYATPHEIRHEALIRVRIAAELAGVPIVGRTVTQAERKEIEMRLPSVLNDLSPMTIDGEKILPGFDRLSYLRIGPSSLNFLQDEDEIRTDADFIGLIYSSPTEGYAQEATVEWSVFPDPVRTVPGNATDSAGPFMADLTPEEPVLFWTNHFKNYEPPVIAPVVYGKERMLEVPVITILLTLLTLGAAVFFSIRQSISGTIRITVLGALVVASVISTQSGWITIENPIAGTPDDPTAKRIAGQLIENSHNALQEKVPERLDAALNTSISADTFEDVKQELERALVIELQGGGAGTVKGIRDLSVANIRSTSGAGAFQASVNWSVTASGDHWGHPHQKNIRFSALMDIAPIDGAWKLTGMTVTSAQPEF